MTLNVLRHIPTPRQLSLTWFGRSAALLGVALLLGACSGLSSEPVIVSTLRPQPTAIPTLARSAPNAPAATEEVGGTGPKAPAATEDATQVAALAPRVGSVNGKITNRTKDASIPKNASVELHIIDVQSNDTTLKTNADADGNFSFKDVTIQADRAYYATTLYHDRTFQSEPQMGNPASDTMAMVVELSELTDSPDALTITSMVVQFTADSEGLTVVQITSFNNDSDRVFSSNTKTDDGRFGSVVFTLPKGALIMRFANGDERYIVGPDGVTITDTQPVMPGVRHVVHVMYRLPYSPSGIIFEQPIGYKVNGSVNVLVGPSSINTQITAGGTTLPSSGAQAMGDVTYNTFNGQVQMAAGSTLRYALNGAVVAGTTNASANTSAVEQSTPVAGDGISRVFIFGGIGLMLLGIVLFIRERRGGRKYFTTEELVAGIAQLDEQYAQHRIDKVRYTSRRKDLKAQLAARMGTKSK